MVEVTVCELWLSIGCQWVLHASHENSALSLFITGVTLYAHSLIHYCYCNHSPILMLVDRHRQGLYPQPIQLDGPKQ